MYVVTFYSFKGGVGRTLALVNIGAELARAGHSVLLVDFDLEAPGLDTFHHLKQKSPGPGIVDYVAEYLRTGTPPEVRGYVHRCSAPSVDQGRLWIMPAGQQNHDYQAKFNAINWQELYSKRDGYLLFENLKGQWSQHFQPNYVLIDSRTGHTDFSGICTRQLPDAVALFFFPNEQNRRGLQTIAEQIKTDHNDVDKQIKLYFVMSNVPDLDDEDRILDESVRAVKDTLIHGEIDATIHHYNSLALLNQAIFVIDRPRSRLAQEYKSLVSIIRRHNPEDREGALDFINSLIRRPSKHAENFTEIEPTLPRIQLKHAHAPQVLSALAKLRRNQNRFDEALALLNQAAKINPRDPDVLLSRAELHKFMNHQAEAVADLIGFLDGSKSSYSDVSRAVRLLIDLAPKELAKLPSSKALKGLPVGAQNFIAWELFSPKVPSSIPEAILRALLHHPSATQADRDASRHRLGLCLMAQGRLEEARTTISGARTTNLSVADTFNYAMADWGITNEMPRDLFSRVIELAPSLPSHTANTKQCLAIAHFALGQKNKAVENLESSRQKARTSLLPELSAWRYLIVPPQDFLTDLDDIERMIEGFNTKPVIFHRNVQSDEGRR